MTKGEFNICASCDEPCESGLCERCRAIMNSRVSWRCFHCDEVFTDRRLAGLHFGATDDAEPACKLGAFDGGLVEALRLAEADAFDARSAMHGESTEGHRAYQALSSRMALAVRSAEESGYARGLADGRAGVDE